MADSSRLKALPINSGQHAADWRRVVSRLFGGAGVRQEVSTRMHLESTAEQAWNVLMFYEDVSGLPPLPLRVFMPAPVRTEGGKQNVGDKVQCAYKDGHLVKRITYVDPPRLIRFEVIEQSLGIEGCVIANGGSYELMSNGEGTDIVATTKFNTYLHPRWLWRPMERLMATQLHLHVLNGMRVAARQAAPIPSQLACRRNDASST